LIFKPVHCGAGCGKHANPVQSGPRSPLVVQYVLYGAVIVVLSPRVEEKKKKKKKRKE
jgi:hypothetical protein